MPKSGFESWLPNRLSVGALREHVFVREPAYSREEARAAVEAAHSFSEALRLLGMRPAGGNH